MGILQSLYTECKLSVLTSAQHFPSEEKTLPKVRIATVYGGLQVPSAVTSGLSFSSSQKLSEVVKSLCRQGNSKKGRVWEVVASF